MCMLCVVPRWSRKIAALFHWGMSPFLPPRLRFEITSPRIACLSVLVLALVWYKALVPLLNYLSVCRAARQYERQQALAIEMQTLWKTAIRRCRNCHTSYRDQNPTGGRFKCSYCGQFSKRPILDIPRSVRSSTFSELMRNCGWIWSRDREALRNTNRGCSTVANFSPFLIFLPFNLIFYLFVNIRWLCKVAFKHSSAEDDSDTYHRGVLCKRGDGGNLYESRLEKTRRKAEEKRQAKLEKEMLEEEERRQREEVARMVEERRKMRDEELKAEGETTKGSIADEERNSCKQAGKRKKDKKNVRDRGSSKSNSDVANSSLNERKHGFYNKNHNERHNVVRSTAMISKSHALETSLGNKVITGKARYSSHITSIFSSRGFGGSIFLGRNTQNPTGAVKKSIKPVTIFMNHTLKNVRNSQVAEAISGNTRSSGDNKILKGNLHQPMNSYVQPCQAILMKPWHQLFANPASTNHPDSTTSTSQNNNSHVEAQVTDLNNQKLLPDNFYDSQTNFTQPFSLTSMTSSNVLFSSTSPKGLSDESLFSSQKESTSIFISGETEIFEDLCYVPDMISLLGPVSEELDKFPLDTGSDFLCNDKVVESQVLKNPSAAGIKSKPSPIECPISRLQNSKEKQTTFGQVSCNLKYQDLHMINVDESQGTWQMWEPPLDQHMGLLGGPS